MDIAKALLKTVSEQPDSAADFSKVLSDALGQDAPAFWNLTVAELLSVLGSTKLGRVMEILVDLQGT